MVLKYFQWQKPVAMAIQEFDAQRLRQKFLRCFFGRFEPAQDLMMREEDAIKREGDHDG